MIAYITAADVAFLLRWIGEHARVQGRTPAAVSEHHPIRRKTSRVVLIGRDPD